jgi:hypothetical protein
MHLVSSLHSHSVCGKRVLVGPQVKRLFPKQPYPRHSAAPMRRVSPTTRAIAEPLAAPSVEDYNKKMAEKMGWTSLDNPFEYRPERGMHCLRPHLLTNFPALSLPNQIFFDYFPFLISRSFHNRILYTQDYIITTSAMMSS